MKRYSLSHPKTIEAISSAVNKLMAKPYGKYLFGGFRNLEPDTQEEEAIFERLRDFLEDHHGPRLEPLFVDDLLDLHKLKKYYPDVLRPNTRVLYRGTVVDGLEVISKELVKEMNFNKTLPDGSPFLENYTYTPRSIIQSWTTDYQSAVDFATGISGNYEDGVVLKAVFKDKDLIFNSEFLNKVQGYNESEIIRIGKSPVKCELYVPLSRVDQAEEFDF